MVGTLHLTDENISHIMTKAGQAHFARVDTANTCRECEHWANQRGERDHKGLLREARCRKALQLTSGNLPPIPHSAWACKHFEAARNPPPI